MRGSIKASDYIAEWLRAKVDHVFGVQGGAAVHLFDSCHRLGPTPIYCHHEQAAAFAALAYARLKGLGVCIVTTGPAASNCLTPCLGAFQDSIPVLFISGQTRVANMSYGTGKRQTASQEAPICDIVRAITVDRIVVGSAVALQSSLEDMYLSAMSRRQGPVWLDLPVDVQWQEI